MMAVKVVPQPVPGPQGPWAAGKGSWALRCALQKTDVKYLHNVFLLTDRQPVPVNFRLRPMHTPSVFHHWYRDKIYSAVQAGDPSSQPLVPLCTVFSGTSQGCLPTTLTVYQVKTPQGQAPSQVLCPSTSSLLENYLKRSHHMLYSSFMAIIQDEVSIRAVTNKYGSHSRQIKYIITQFEYSQQYRIYNKHKKLVENIN